MASRCLFPAAVTTAFVVGILFPVESFADASRPHPKPQPYFERNVGQAPRDVHFIMRTPALNGALTTGGFSVFPRNGAARLLRLMDRRHLRV